MVRVLGGLLREPEVLEAHPRSGRRELVETQGDQHKPALARALTNLSACLSRSGRAPAALGAATQAVEIFTELVELHPHAYRAELAAAEHNWSVCREAVGEAVDG